jgi:hypothetical protein
MKSSVFAGLILYSAMVSPLFAGWSFSDGPTPNAFIQTSNTTLELQCDRIRFVPAGYEDSQDIFNKQGLSIRFMKNGSTEVGSFQAGDSNASISIVDNYPVEIVFNDPGDYEFILQQIAENAIVNLSMIDEDVTYGLFDLRGSGAAIRSLRSACDDSAYAGAMEVPEGISEPDPDLVFVRGYRFADDVCMLTGESAFTVDFLDDAADLVTCPTGHPAAAELVAETNASLVTQTNSFTLYSVPRR